MYDTQRERDVDEALLTPRKTFEGTYDIKEWKNDNGHTYPFIVSASSESKAKDGLKQLLDEVVQKNGWHSHKINQITERK